MANKTLLTEEIKKFIRSHEKTDLPALILKGSPFAMISIQELATQIHGRKIARKKFPYFYENEDILYPPKLNLEQTSSEVTAKYKASLIDGKNGIDLTGGLGIDTYFISRNFEEFTYCELNPGLAKIAEHNFRVLNAENIHVISSDGIQVVTHSEKKFDWIYADPARRDEHGSKVFKLAEYTPDIPSNLKKLFTKADRVLIKTAPLLDISAGLKELGHVKEVHIIAVKNEVKELLWLMERNFAGEPEIITVNFEGNEVQTFSASKNDFQASAILELPQKFLYEPNAAIMKSGLFDEIAIKTQTLKLHQHSHLYTSQKALNFPGRKFEIIEVIDFNPSELKQRFKSRKANITTRNFPESVEQIRKRFKIKEGGTTYLFFTTNVNDEKIVIVCKKLSS